ncbi:uncharacterized protein LOC115695274 [Cannabis sativa]|uniref:uncharacterized protein LOC115695274 n=1 Tax=Cannabis sativa TaxID=3483 RepID=UPI0011DFD8CF|nr:uncharacterized protein LOC115695274 [Cannabis sativa]
MESRKSVVKGILRRGPMVSQEHSELLVRKITIEEVKKGVFDIPGSKSLGPDVEWQFIKEMLRGLQFPYQFVNLIMQCITTPRFSLMFNGTLHGFFKSKRGLRQGDPISPLLFVIEMEYLSRLMRKIGDKDDFHDICIELKWNHLAIADDVILFSKGDERSVRYLLQALKLVSVTFRLQPNPSKTAIYCSNMEPAVVERLLKISSFSNQNFPFTYLGIPINAKKKSGRDSEILIEKMTARIRCWSSRNLSFCR